MGRPVIPSKEIFDELLALGAFRFSVSDPGLPIAEFIRRVRAHGPVRRRREQELLELLAQARAREEAAWIGQLIEALFNVREADIELSSHERRSSPCE